LELVTLKEINDKSELDRKRVQQERDELFDFLQLRCAELESSKTRLGELQSRIKELEFRLRASDDELALLTESITEQRAVSRDAHLISTSSEDISRLLLETEGRYEAKLADARQRIKLLEKERGDTEEEWMRGLDERAKTIEDLKCELNRKKEEVAEIISNQQTTVNTVITLESMVAEIQNANSELRTRNLALKEHDNVLREESIHLRQELHDATEQIQMLTLQEESFKNRDAQLKSVNKVCKIIIY
jgi:hypothetical protein